MPFELRFKETLLNYGVTSNFNLNITNIYIVYKYDRFPYFEKMYTLGWIFVWCSETTWTNKSDYDTYEYTGRGLALDRTTGGYSFDDGNGSTSWAQNIVIFGSDNSQSKIAENKKHTYCIVGKGASEFNNYVCYPESNMKINQTDHTKKFVVSLHYNGDNSYLFCNGIEQVKFRAINYPTER